VPFGVQPLPGRYVYAAAGEGESSTDLAWDGQTMVHEAGVLAETERFPRGPRRAVADVDLDLLRAERLRVGTFDDNRRHHAARIDDFRIIDYELSPPPGDLGLRRVVERFPFVPADEDRLAHKTATRPTTSKSPGSRSACERSAIRRSCSASRAASTRPTS
jgi:hypothetical protein